MTHSELPLARITNLPVEILVRIFRQLRDAHITSCSHRWLFVTHVCRSWRLIALDAASLWSCIYSSNRECVAAFLVRSKKAPLDIHYPARLGRREDVSVTSMVLAESYRFRSVALARSGEAHQFLECPFPQGAILLQHLSLVYHKLSDIWIHAPTTEVDESLKDVIPAICTQGPPALRLLELEYWPVASFASIRGLINPSLRSLTIRLPSTRFTLLEWSTILAGLPLLKRLALMCVFQIRGPEDELEPKPKPLPLIQLPHLQSLELIADSWIDQVSLLRAIVPSANIHLDFRPWALGALAARRISYKGYIDILDAVNQKFTPRESRNEAITPNYLSLQITDSFTRCFSIEVTLEYSNHGYCPRSELKNNLHTPPLLRLRLNNVDPARQSTPSYKPLCDMLRKTFALEKISMMRLGPANARGLSQNTLLDLSYLFAQLTNIQVLYIRSADKDYLGNYLSTLLGVSNVENEAEKGAVDAIQESRISFPALEVLTVEHPMIYAPVDDVEPLRRTLLSCKAAGYPISKIHICLYKQRRLDKQPLWPALEPKLLPLISLGCTIDYCDIDLASERAHDVA